MADITKCSGEGCPIKESCFRFTSIPDEYQSWLVEVPARFDSEGKFKNCYLFWGTRQQSIFDALNDIVRGKGQ